jgi:hypothetical protein
MSDGRAWRQCLTKIVITQFTTQRRIIQDTVS